MISKFLREQKRYTQKDLCDILECLEDKAVPLIRKLKEFGVLKAVKASTAQKNMSDLIDEDIEIADVEVGENEYLYVFTFVGVITVAGRILKCYPKNLLTTASPKNELKQVIKVLEKYNSKEQIIRMFNDSSESQSFNLLAVLLFLMNDYYENGVYSNTEDIIESNGAGEILWDKTINETFTLLSDNRPYYTDLQTKKRVNDDFDYFKRLHECVLTQASNELKEADLIDLFEVVEVSLSDEELIDFGDKEYILYRIEKELNTQFNTRKQLVLKTIYAYIEHSGSLYDIDSLSMFGTNSFNLVWEKVCAEVMNNQLEKPLGTLQLPVSLHAAYNKSDLLISLIEKPTWYGKNANGSFFGKKSKDTLIPDLISIHKSSENYSFIIFDAKYYNIQIEVERPLRGQPGIESITKQYLYQLAYKKFVEDHKITDIKNCFLMPIDGDTIINKGYVQMNMLSDLGLENIQVIMLPTRLMYEHYLNNNKIDINLLNL